MNNNKQEDPFILSSVFQSLPQSTHSFLSPCSIAPSINVQFLFKSRSCSNHNPQITIQRFFVCLFASLCADCLMSEMNGPVVCTRFERYFYLFPSFLQFEYDALTTSVPLLVFSPFFLTQSPLFSTTSFPSLFYCAFAQLTSSCLLFFSPVAPFTPPLLFFSPTAAVD